MTDTKFDLRHIINTAKQVITAPKQFYQQMPVSGGFSEPIIYIVVLALVTAFIIAFYSLLGLGSLEAMSGMQSGLSAMLFFPIMAIIACFISAAVLFIIWKLMGSEYNYETAFRCIAYTFAIAPIIALLSVIPYLPNIIKTIWICFLLIIASTEVHKLPEKTAKIVFIILAIIGVFFGIKSERSLRVFSSKAENISQASEEIIKGLENMSPEEAGEKIGGFLKGLEKSMQDKQTNE